MPDHRLETPTDFPPPLPRRRRVGWILLLLIGGLWLAASTAVSYYVDALWFASLGYADVFWKSLNIQAFVFGAFAALTFLILYGAFLALRPPRFGESGFGNVIVINGQPVSLPVGPMLRLLALVISLVVALVTGTAMMANWPQFALWWYGAGAGTVQAGVPTDPIFGRSIAFYLFTLPAWNLIVDWLMTLAILVIAIAGFFALVGGAVRRGRLDPRANSTLRGVALAWALVLLAMAAQVYLGRFERLLDDHTIFAGVTYTEAHVTLTGMLIVAGLLALGALAAAVSAFAGPAPPVARRGSSARCARVSRDRGGRCVPERIHRQTERAGEGAALHRAQHRADAPGIRAQSDLAARLSRRDDGRGRRSREQSGHAPEHPALGLARAPGHAQAAPGNPHVLRLPGHRHRSLHDRRRAAADDAGDARAERGQAAREQPQLDQRKADLHPRLRHHDEPGQRLHARRPPDADPQGHAGPEQRARDSR